VLFVLLGLQGDQARRADPGLPLFTLFTHSVHNVKSGTVWWDRRRLGSRGPDLLLGTARGVSTMPVPG